MKKVWPWIIGTIVVLCIIGLVWFGASNRQAYRVARGAINQRVAATQDQIDVAVEAAIAAVDKALELTAGLPSQEAKADLIKADIEEIGNRLNEAVEASGDAAVDKLNESIDQFNQTLETVDKASNEATSPAAIATLNRIYGILTAVKESLAQIILMTPK
jgi:hypothetical protein